ncbi:MAG: DUF1573 domain-containing protein [Cyclobacteriaceae bacterium]|jgi:hypothetical protein|nr:DUF1573 domain-containing protein [Flammeovirgaceae bacterium]
MASEKHGRYFDFFLYAFFVAGIVVFAVKQLNKSETNYFDTYPKTEIKFENFIDLGQVPSIKPIIFDGFFKNIGNTELHIANLKTLCCCTEFLIKDLIVQPRDSTSVSFTILPTEQGSDVVSLYFDANTRQQKHEIKVTYETVK